MPKSKMGKNNIFSIRVLHYNSVTNAVKSSSHWFVLIFLNIVLLGLGWLLIFQLVSINVIDVPICLQWIIGMDFWNYIISFTLIFIGLLLAMHWH